MKAILKVLSLQAGIIMIWVFLFVMNSTCFALFTFIYSLIKLDILWIGISLLLVCLGYLLAVGILRSMMFLLRNGVKDIKTPGVLANIAVFMALVGLVSNFYER